MSIREKEVLNMQLVLIPIWRRHGRKPIPSYQIC